MRLSRVLQLALLALLPGFLGGVSGDHSGAFFVQLFLGRDLGDEHSCPFLRRLPLGAGLGGVQLGYGLLLWRSELLILLLLVHLVRMAKMMLLLVVAMLVLLEHLEDDCLARRGVELRRGALPLLADVV